MEANVLGTPFLAPMKVLKNGQFSLDVMKRQPKQQLRGMLPMFFLAVRIRLWFNTCLLKMRAMLFLELTHSFGSIFGHFFHPYKKL
jgi:hypothetical protein